MTFFSTHHSPITVNKNAKVFTIGTVKLSSAPGERLVSAWRRDGTHREILPTPQSGLPHTGRELKAQLHLITPS
jgi:hypothetical protein